MRNRLVATTLAIASAMALIVVPSSPAGALTPDEIGDRIDSLKATLKVVAEDLSHAEHDLIETEEQIAEHSAALREASRRRSELRDALSLRAAQLYMYGSISDLEILNGDGIGTFIDRIAYLEAMRRGEQGLLEEVRALQRKAEEVTVLLRAARARALEAKRRLDARQASLSSQLGELQRLQSFLGDTSRQIIGGSANGFICPVVGANIPSANYGDPRPGGPHAGIDIRASHGQLVRAVLPGTIVDTPYGSWWGIGIVLRDLSGTEWYYAHLSSESVSVGQRVASGEIIGRVGCTGRCYGTHLHFEWHPGGGAPRDPYGIVSNAC